MLLGIDLGTTNSLAGWIFTLVFIKGIAAVFAAVLFLSLPLTYLAQALGYGTRYAATTLTLALGTGLLFQELGQSWFFCLLLMPMVTAGLQVLTTRLSKMRWLRIAARD